MHAREIVRVFPVRTGWVVSSRGGSLQQRYQEKDEAEEQGRRIAQSHRPSTLMVLTPDGEIEYEVKF